MRYECYTYKYLVTYLVHVMNEREFSHQTERTDQEHAYIVVNILAKKRKKTLELQWRHLIPALNVWADRAYYKTARLIAT